MSTPEVDAGTRPRGWDELARSAAAPGAQGELAPRREFLTFRLLGDPYAVPIERVREIVRLRHITSVPRVPFELRGVISLRGEIVQVVELRKRLGMPPIEPTRASRIIVLHGEGGDVAGVLVDEVVGVLRVEEERVLSPPEGESEFVGALCERDGAFVSVVNLDRVLDIGAA